MEVPLPIHHHLSPSPSRSYHPEMPMLDHLHNILFRWVPLLLFTSPGLRYTHLGFFHYSKGFGGNGYHNPPSTYPGELVIGDRQTGKTSISTDAIINQRYTNTHHTYNGIAEKASSICHIFLALIRRDAASYLTSIPQDFHSNPSSSTRVGTLVSS